MGRTQDVRPSEKITLAAVVKRYLEHVTTTKRPNSERRDKDSAKAILNGFGSEIAMGFGLIGLRVAKTPRSPFDLYPLG